jgi:acyl-CoA synthetase (AMP-forming)/AMP-acid ligase II
VSRCWLLDRLAEWGDREALAGLDSSVSYGQLLTRARSWDGELTKAGIRAGKVVAFEGDFSPATVSLFLALLERACVAVPLASVTPSQRDEFLKIAGAEFVIDCHARNQEAVLPRESSPSHPLIARLAEAGRPGLVLFSSGSTGKPKAMLHDFDTLLEKFRQPRPTGRMLSFLLLDHIGGVNTLFHSLAGGGTVITVRERSPEAVCAAVERHRADVLPTSPTFLNLLLLSEAYRGHDLSSLRLITYGTEVMPASTLARLREVFPGVRLQQTYGLSELGILRSKSREDGSLWVKIGGEGYETEVRDGVLWIRARTAILGYLNADSPFDADGWFNTQDAVEQDGEWLRFLGRVTEIINVGGQKVYPAEVESTLLEMDHVADVTVRGERNPLLGQCVVARVNLNQPESAPEFKLRMRKHCQGRLAPYMVPVKVEIVTEEQYNVRGKRLRRP